MLLGETEVSQLVPSLLLLVPLMSFASRWLDVETGPEEAALTALPTGVALLDLHGDGDYRLLVGDMGNETVGSKLKIFKGAEQAGELPLPGLPVAVVGFYATETMPRAAPVAAVALGAAVYVYKSMRLFYKYYLPSLELNAAEMDVWRQLTELHQQEIDIIKIVERLKSIPYNYLSPQSQQILSLDPARYLDYIKQSKNTPIKKSSEVTCMATLKMNSVDKFAVSCLVLGTEDGDILFLDPQTFTQLHYVKICDIKMTPYQIIATGLYEVDYRITVATRENSICVLKREWSEGKCIASLDAYIVAIEVMPGDDSIIVICMDSTMRCYNKKGKKQWSVSLEQAPVALTLLPIVHLGAVLAGVALRSGHLQLYSGKAQVDSIFVKDVVSAMRFGQLGQEEHVLVIITLAGDLILKILKRTADFNLYTASPDFGPGAAAAAPAQHKPWLIPKKSKLFLEQSVRERENAVAMHKTFQQELNRVRLVAARTLVTAHRRSENSVGVGSAEPVRLSAEVEGLGPKFRVLLVIENTSPDTAVSGMSVLFHVDPSYYKVSRPYIQVPPLAPGGRLTFPSTVEEAPGTGPPLAGAARGAAAVRLLLLRRGRRAPLLAATVRVPPTDPIMLPYEYFQSTGQFA